MKSGRPVALVFTTLAAASGMAACSLLVDTGGLSADQPADAPVNAPARDGAPAPSDAADGAPDGAFVNVSPDAGSCPSPPDPSLVLWYPLDEPDDTQIVDCSASHLDTNPSATATLRHVMGHTGRAIDLDGRSCFDLGVATPLAFADVPFTVTAWIMPRTFSSSGGDNPKPLWFVDRFGGSSDAGSTGRGWGMGTDDVSGVEIKFFDASGAFFEAQADDTPTATWVHVARVYDAGTLFAYESGRLVTSTATGAKPAVDAAAHGWLGCRGGDEAGYDGLLDDVRVYARALAPNEIAELAR